MLRPIKQLYEIFDRHGRLQFLRLLVVAGIAGVFQLVGVGSVVPFIGILASPNIVKSNPLLREAYTVLGFQSHESFLLAAAVAMVAAVLVSNCVNALALYMSLKFGAEQRNILSERLLRNYVSKPYLYFLTTNTASLSRDILSEITVLQTQVIIPMSSIFVSSVTILTILVALVAVDPIAALVTGTMFGGSYALIYRLCRQHLRQLGQQRLIADRTRFKVANELLNGQREARLLNCRQSFIEVFNQATVKASIAQTQAGVIGQLPRQGLEVLGFVAIAGLVIYFVSSGRVLADFLPILSLYAVCAIRLLPQLQALFQAFAALRFSIPTLDRLHPELTYQSKLEEKLSPALAWSNTIELKGLEFRYPNSDAPVLDGLTVAIRKNTTVAFVGSTGAGKTTLINILLGLIPPTSGSFTVDGIAINEDTLSPWQAAVGFVPQDIFLMDDTIGKNIAYGSRDEDIDTASVERAARLAQLHEFVAALPDGYRTEVGERGVRLSGGQRQRLGIARALYRDPSILIFDEATSALDGLTEEAVMDSIQSLGKTKTIVLIAHRITTLKDCDEIFLLEKGKVRANGSYQDLLGNNQTFQGFARISAPA